MAVVRAVIDTNLIVSYLLRFDNNIKYNLDDDSYTVYELGIGGYR